MSPIYEPYVYHVSGRVAYALHKFVCDLLNNAWKWPIPVDRNIGTQMCFMFGRHARLCRKLQDADTKAPMYFSGKEVSWLLEQLKIYYRNDKPKDPLLLGAYQEIFVLWLEREIDKQQKRKEEESREL